MEKPRSRRILSLLCALAVLPGLAVWVIWGNTALMLHTVTVSGSRVPPEFSGFRIAQVSDLHNAQFGEGNEKLLRTISEGMPDVIAVTGDLVDARHTDIDAALAFVREAARIAPVYYVTGNHEASLPQYEALRAGLEASGAAVLEDEAVRLEHNGGEVLLIGLSDPDFTVRGDMFGEVPAMTGTKLNRLTGDGEKYTILLSHRPELFETYASCGIDLVFSGHAHGGQFRLPLAGGLIAPNQGFFPKYDGGLYTDGSTRMIVSRGLGNSIIPFRVNNRPEVVVAVLRAES